jgi:hypothetical protein
MLRRAFCSLDMSLGLDWDRDQVWVIWSNFKLLLWNHDSESEIQNHVVIVHCAPVRLYTSRYYVRANDEHSMNSSELRCRSSLPHTQTTARDWGSYFSVFRLYIIRCESCDIMMAAHIECISIVTYIELFQQLERISLIGWLGALDNLHFA